MQASTATETLPIPKTTCSATSALPNMVTPTEHSASADDRTQVERHKTGFLDLPGELRNIIYDYALDTHKPIQLVAQEWVSEDHSLPHKPAVNVNLLATCRQIRQEASSRFYQNATFEIRPDYVAGVWSSYFDQPAKGACDCMTSERVRLYDVERAFCCSRALISNIVRLNVVIDCLKDLTTFSLLQVHYDWSVLKSMASLQFLNVSFEHAQGFYSESDMEADPETTDEPKSAHHVVSIMQNVRPGVHITWGPNDAAVVYWALWYSAYL